MVVNQLSSDFTAVTPEGSIRLHLDMPGLHNVQNIMPDIAIARELGVTLEEMKDKIEQGAITYLIEGQGLTITEAANKLGISRQMLHRKIKKHKNP